MYFRTYFTGISSAILSLVSMTVNMDNFPPQHRGLIVGTIGASWWLGSAIIAAIYNTFFAHSPVGNFFLFMGILNFTVSALCAWLVRPLPHAPGDDERKTLTPENSAEDTQSTDPETESFIEKCGMNMLCVLDFHIILWGFMFAGSVQLTFLPNVTTISDSYGFTEYNSILTVVGPLCACACKFTFTCSSDYTKAYFPRIIYVTALCLIQTLVTLASIFVGDNRAMFLSVAILVYSANGTFWGVLPAVVSEYFGMPHFSRNFGFMFLLLAIFSFAILEIFGDFYEAQIKDINSENCFGLQCFKKFYILATALNIVSTVLFGVLCIKEMKK